MPIKNAPTGKTEPEFTEPIVDRDEETSVVSADFNTAPKPPIDDTEYVFVKYPDGSTRAIPRADVDKANAAVTFPDAPKTVAAEDDTEVYAWLADGSVERVKQSELPGTAGTNAVHGYYERDGKTYSVVAVHPVEHETSDR